MRTFSTGWYRELVTALPEIVDGHVTLPAGPGFGLELLPGVEKRPDAARRVSRA